MKKVRNYLVSIGVFLAAIVSIAAFAIAYQANQEYQKIDTEIEYDICIHTDRVQTLTINAILKQTGVVLSPELEKRLKKIIKCARREDR